MTYDLSLFDTAHLCLEIDPALQAQAWQRSQLFATPTSQWNAYLNDVCLNTVLAWLREDYDAHATPYPNAVSLASFWEVVPGSAIVVRGMRLVLIPTETIDADELRIPQEWVDLPSWASDYYVSVQVNLDEAWLRINGFISHRQLKQKGQYDWHDRTYGLDAADLIADINALWVAQQLVPNQPTMDSTANLATLSLPQANALIQRLGNAAIVNPRLAIPFEQWGALMAHGGWRQQLMERRRGLPEQRSIMDWLRSGISNVAQNMGWERVEFQPSVAAARGEIPMATLALARSFTIHQHPYELLVSSADPNINIWRFELRALTPGRPIPAGYTLRLLTEDLQAFEGNEDSASNTVDQLYIDVELEPGEGLVWEVDPIPDGYDQEILRF